MKMVRTLSIIAFLLLLNTAAVALNPARDIHQLAHRSWGEKDGYPGRAEALAQTTDGFLWLGTDSGLFRFDGVHFERYVPRSGDALSKGPVRGLRALSDGSLWIAYRLDRKICVLLNGNLKCYDKEDGVTSAPTNIVQDHEGTIWANTEAGVIRLNGLRWEHIGKDWNFPDDVPQITSDALFVDSHGTLWVGVNHTVMYLKQGSRRFEPTGAYAGWSTSIAEAPNGTIWLSDILSYVREISMSVSAKSAAMAKCEVETPKGTLPNCLDRNKLVVKARAAVHLLFDRSGSLWMSTDTSGVDRIPHPEQLRDESISEASDGLQTFTSKDGLSADTCTPILEDREGNIWVATQNGLDQFRDTALVPVPLPASLYRVALAPAEKGDVWVVGSWAYVGRIHDHSSDRSFQSTDAFKAYRDPAGVIWLLGSSLGRWKDGRFREVVNSPDGSAAGGPGMWQVAGDKSGTLWAFSSGHGFSWLEHGHWKAWATPPQVAKQRVVNMFSDSTGCIWVTTFEGDVITMDRGTLVDYPRKPESPLRYVKAFAEHAPHEIWAGGEGGLAMIDRGHFRLLKAAGTDPLEDVTGIVDAKSQGLWLNTSSGAVHIFKNELDRALRDPSYRFNWELFDSSEGLPGQAESIYPYPKAIQGTDGRIWFTATRGLAWIDPENAISRNTLPPPLSITSISADGFLHLRLDNLRLPAHTANVQIDYTAPSLSAPEHVRFRYKLDGIDRGWQDVGNRRQAFYTNLGPGSYEFRVIACNNDGVWNETGASVNFSVAPAYYQTAWFRLICIALFLLLLWAGYLFRVRQLEGEFAALVQARVDERTRIARELHDTLLQSFHALLLRFQTVSNLLPARPEEAKTRIEGVVQEGSNAITEGRDAVHELRSIGLMTGDLAESIRNFAKEVLGGLSNDNLLEFCVQVEGTPKHLNSVVRDELYRIAGEALRNTIRHAGAQRIEVLIRYESEHLKLNIRDDGKGIDKSVLEKEHAPGHWGLRGMRERARVIGGSFEIWSKLGSGTEIELKVSANKAYAKPSSAHWPNLSNTPSRGQNG